MKFKFPLHNLFQRTGGNLAEDVEMPTHPLIYAVIGDDEPTRGDCRAIQGVASAVAAKTNGSLRTINFKEMKSVSGADHITDHKRCLEELMKKDGIPDIVIGVRNSHDPNRDVIDVISKMDNPGQTLVVTGNSPKLSGHYTGYDELVPHHLTPENLAREGQKFSETYGDRIDGDLVAVMLTSHEQDNMIRKIAETARHTGDRSNPVTLFLCGCKRTSESFLEGFRNIIEQSSSGQDQSSQLNIITYHMSDTADNPYIGLLDQADHIVVSGKSSSIVCEGLATGKSVFTTDDSHECEAGIGMKKFRSKGFVKSFGGWDSDKGFKTEKIDPINATQDVADGIIDDFKHMLAGRDLPGRHYNPDTEKPWRRYVPAEILSL